MAIKSKKKTSAVPSNPKKQIIKVNPYENPENVMGLMARICSATASVETDVYWNSIREAYNKEIKGKSLADYLEEPDSGLLNRDFYNDLDNNCRYLSWELTDREDTEHTKIVVAGGFSSGKSSFLNRITSSINLLPTGVEPVSVVKTYLYCSKDCRNIAVKGVNQKNVLVTLEPGVLQAIQHANRSNVYLASVLDKLFVEIPSKNYNGIVFIDTPGYNNSDRANKSNGKTDRQTAMEAIKEGNVLFWFVDCEHGALVTQDIEMIKSFEGKKVIIFNKADKKGSKECKKIVDQAAKTLYREMPKQDFIDILAFSTLDNRIYYSLNNFTIAEIISRAKKCGNGKSEMRGYRDAIAQLFDAEIEACQNEIESIESQYPEKVKLKDTGNEAYREARNDEKEIVKDLKEILIDGYDELENQLNAFCAASKYACDAFQKFYNGVWDFEKNDHWGNSSILDTALKNADYQYDKAVDKHNAACEISEGTYSSAWRNDLIEQVKKHETWVVAYFKDIYDCAAYECDNLKKRKESEEQMIKAMSEYKRIMLAAVDAGIRKFQQQNKATSVHRTMEEAPSIFQSIQIDNYQAFLRCFEQGVDISVCDVDGYNPLTLAVFMGNNTMVRFLLEHGADPALQDRRGYNAFHTAVENQYRDICKMLLDNDPELIDTETAQGETVEELAQKQTFSKWIENEIDNIF